MKALSKVWGNLAVKLWSTFILNFSIRALHRLS